MSIEFSTIHCILIKVIVEKIYSVDFEINHQLHVLKIGAFRPLVLKRPRIQLFLFNYRPKYTSKINRSSTQSSKRTACSFPTQT